MSRKDIIGKMQEAGLKAPARGEFIFIHWDQIAMLLDYERAAEREACAQVCDDQERQRRQAWHRVMTSGGEVPMIGPIECAAAIRARGQA